MKRLLSLCLTALLALSLAACGGGQTANSSSAAQKNLTDQSAGSAQAAPAETDTVPTVTFQSENNEYKDDAEQTVVMREDLQVPTVTVPGNEAAQKAIQAQLDAIVSQFRADSEEIISGGKQEYANAQENGNTEDFFPFFHSLTFTPARCDGAVLSLVVEEAGYQGGAHGLTYRYGRTYDIATGKQLTLTDLGEGLSETALPILSQFVQAVRDKDGVFFPDASEEDLKSVVSDETCYLSDSGLVFISGQYQLQPYAAGIVLFTVSYDDLAGKLKDDYNPGGGVTRCETAETVYTFGADGALESAPLQEEETPADSSAA